MKGAVFYCGRVKMMTGGALHAGGAGGRRFVRIGGLGMQVICLSVSSHSILIGVAA